MTFDFTMGAFYHDGEHCAHFHIWPSDLIAVLNGKIFQISPYLNAADRPEKRIGRRLRIFPHASCKAFFLIADHLQIYRRRLQIGVTHPPLQERERHVFHQSLPAQPENTSCFPPGAALYEYELSNRRVHLHGIHPR